MSLQFNCVWTWGFCLPLKSDSSLLLLLLLHWNAQHACVRYFSRFWKLVGVKFSFWIMIVYGALKDKLKSCPLHDNSRNCHEIVLMWVKERWRGTFHVQTEPLTVRQIFSKMKILLSKGKTCSRSTNMTLIKPIAVTSITHGCGRSIRCMRWRSLRPPRKRTAALKLTTEG